MSAGRAAAAAYIGVNTVLPGLSARETQSAVKLSSTLLEENVRFRTEPSLLRRGRPSDTFDDAALLAAGLPPRRRRSKGRSERPPVIALVGVLALLVGALSVLVAHYQAHSTSEQVLWEHGIDGQPGYLDTPANRAREPNGPSPQGSLLLDPQVVEAPLSGEMSSAPILLPGVAPEGGPLVPADVFDASGSGGLPRDAGPETRSPSLSEGPVSSSRAGASGPRSAPKVSRGSRGGPGQDLGAPDGTRSALPPTAPSPTALSPSSPPPSAPPPSASPGAEEEEPWLE